MTDESPTLSKEAQAKIESAKERAEVAKAKKAEAEARQAQSIAEQEEIKARFASIPAPPSSGTIELTDDAGTTEATMLASVALNKAAQQIRAQVGGRPPKPANSRLKGEKPRYIVFSGNGPSASDHLQQYLTQSRLVAQQFETANALSEAAIAKMPSVSARLANLDLENATFLKTFEQATAAIGAGLDFAAQVGAYFQSDYKLGSLGVKGIDDELLTDCVVGLLEEPWYPGRSAAPRTANPTTTLLPGSLLTALKTSRQTQHALSGELQSINASAQTEAEEPPKADLLWKSKLMEEAIAAHVSAQQAFEKFTSMLEEKDANGATFASKVIAEQSIADMLAKGHALLLIKLKAAPAAYYTKKNLWSFLGGAPLYLSTGVIASYVAIEGISGKVLFSGSATHYSGYARVHEVSTFMRYP